MPDLIKIKIMKSLFQKLFSLFLLYNFSDFTPSTPLQFYVRFSPFPSAMNTDMCLIKNNARVAAQIAVELEKQRNGGDGKELHVASGHNAIGGNETKPTPVVVGGSIVDVHYRVLEENLEVSFKFFLPEKSQD